MQFKNLIYEDFKYTLLV